MVKKAPVSSMDKQQTEKGAIDLLRQLISTPSFSREEDRTATLIQDFLQDQEIRTHRFLNNIWATNYYFEEGKPSILLNSHHDTVKPNPGYTMDPFTPVEKEGKLFGLGSNDAGGPLVSLMATFIHFYKEQNLPFNLVFAATAEEEISGKNGVEALLPELPPIHSALVGEPTKMQMAVAERGLLVLDCIAKGKAGHAARQEGVNAIYKAMEDISWIRQYRFDHVSDLLGPVQMTVTSIETENKAHNVVPAECSFVVDVRVNEHYTMEEVITTVETHLNSSVRARSTRLRSTSIGADHPLVKAGKTLGMQSYGSPTTSDKALMPFPALKIGPGDSARSHTADEYIFTEEINKGIAQYIELLNLVAL